jgi:hypothetical protein
MIGCGLLKSIWLISLRQNKGLEDLSLQATELFDLIPLFLDSLKLKSLTLIELSITTLKSSRFWKSIMSQANSLLSLVLENNGGLVEERWEDYRNYFHEIPDWICRCIYNLTKLRKLHLRAIRLRVSVDDLSYILHRCRDLEEIKVATEGYIMRSHALMTLKPIDRPIRLRKLCLLYCSILDFKPDR